MAVPSPALIQPHAPVLAILLALLALGCATGQPIGAEPASPRSGQVLRKGPPVTATAVRHVEVEDMAHVPFPDSPFWIDRNEVTVSEYERCVQERECAEPYGGEPISNCDAYTYGLSEEQRSRLAGRRVGGELLECNWKRRDARRFHPMNCITYHEAERYCRSLGKRLPDSQEWLYAATGSDGRRFPWGDESPSHLLDRAYSLVPDAGTQEAQAKLAPARNRICWEGDRTDSTGTYATSTCPVGGRTDAASPFGVLDMLGNVSEWVTDHGTHIEELRHIQSRGWRVWHCDGWDVDELSLEDQRELDPNNIADDIGFRCVSDSDPSAEPSVPSD